MIRIIDEIRLEDFEAWSGGRRTLQAIREYDCVEEVEDIIHTIYMRDMCEPWSRATLNDFLWFTLKEYLADDVNLSYETDLGRFAYEYFNIPVEDLPEQKENNDEVQNNEE